jgi:hypothetical protein
MTRTPTAERLGNVALVPRPAGNGMSRGETGTQRDFSASLRLCARRSLLPSRGASECGAEECWAREWGHGNGGKGMGARKSRTMEGSQQRFFSFPCPTFLCPSSAHPTVGWSAEFRSASAWDETVPVLVPHSVRVYGTVQSSSNRLGTRENSRVLFVTRVPPATRAVAAIHKSASLMGIPNASYCVRIPGKALGMHRTQVLPPSA